MASWMVASIIAVAGLPVLGRLAFIRVEQLERSGRLHELPEAELDRRIFRRFTRPYRLPLVTASTFTLAMVLLELAAPWPIAIVIDSVIGTEPFPAVLGGVGGWPSMAVVVVAAVTLIGLAALGGAAGYVVDFLNGAVQALIGSDLRSTVFRRLQTASTRFHDQHRTGDLLARLSSDVSYVEDMLVAWFETVLPEALTVVGVFVIVAIIDPVLALVAIAVIPLLIWWARRAHSSVRHAELAARVSSGRMLDRASDALRHVRAVQVFSQEATETEAFTAKSNQAASSQVTAVERAARLSPLADVLLAVGSAAVLVVGAQRVLAGNLSVGVLVVLVAYIGQLYGPVESLSLVVMTMGRGAASRDRLLDLLGSDRGVDEIDGAPEAPSKNLTIELVDVSFGYEPDRLVLHDVSFEVQPGETVAIVGPTGAGKSSILSLLVRLYDPAAGSILLAGVDIRELRLASLRSRIALVPQDLWILDGSIFENIAFGDSYASHDTVEYAADLALVTEFSDRLRDGLDTSVGEEGVRLSGGQRRRIALARALVRNAPIVVLDEPTAGLDAEAAADVISAIRRTSQERTVIIVTHDLRLASGTDRIYVIENGRNRECGSHHELLASNSRYAELWRARGFPPRPSALDPAANAALSVVDQRGKEVS